MFAVKRLRATSLFKDCASASEVASALRNMACLLLVTYHVIGSSPGVGLRIGYPHSLRIFADLLIDVRMPLFAFVAGLVYALRPPDFRSLAPFAMGKIRRLLVPGAVAALTYAAFSTALGLSFAVEPMQAWKVLVFPYAHFWFLQAIFTIILGVALLDAVSRGWLIVPLLAVAVLLSVLDFSISLKIFSLYSVVYLAPYYLLGVMVVRYRGLIMSLSMPISIACAALLVIGLAINLEHYHVNGFLSRDRQDVQSLITGISVCLIAFLAVCFSGSVIPHGSIGPYTFTIYLYHVFGTSAARKVLEAIGVTDETSLLLSGIISGVSAPIIVHLIAERHPLSRRLVLGETR